ncbi:hypothetical protein HF998_05425 [Cellulomonas hominis]|uniref:Uncharacterized protein n=1 Tax=Cellulomonas hominis TaxID=156981 RepID=A0A7W8SIX2_9CELL|nr:hypothetical protein [Cellulomonas hominis]MBB5474885.1 hypothetical protein [Cellulomonas hominis]NKY06421.1 hypothetical protein [Cellulomonas hominis]
MTRPDQTSGRTLEPRGAVRTPGALRGQIEVPDGARDLTDEELEDWYGR